MSDIVFEETFVDSFVTYSVEIAGKIYVVENVPARVSQETGEKLFAPETVDRLQEIIWSLQPPLKVVETPVYSFS
ncbi:hypothetical protein FEK30_03780 [Picosynechococcus sp. PCC 11901]|uniref:hypothetical protein n=1 Tax=Picosynechococcus sp. PCC 11901 TaxID=2579791 RepID=UPI0010FBC5C4|nr:hypothetical protein [Picosynechococcus sp. PCC 11901]QCS48619.1 hypothetical protein FEK30_03780 [Picosynechococcus sp. PCC 11901]